MWAIVAGWRATGEAGPLTFVRAHNFAGDRLGGLDVPVARSAEPPPPPPQPDEPSVGDDDPPPAPPPASASTPAGEAGAEDRAVPGHWGGT